MYDEKNDNAKKQIDYKYYTYIWDTFMVQKYINKVYEAFGLYFNIDRITLMKLIKPNFKYNIRLFLNHQKNETENDNFDYYCKGSIQLIDWDILIDIKKYNINKYYQYFDNYNQNKLYFRLYRNNIENTIESIKISRNYLCDNHLIYYKMPTDIDSDYLDVKKIDTFVYYLKDIQKFMNYMKDNLILPLNKMWKNDLNIYFLIS